MKNDPISSDEWALIQRHLLGETTADEAREAQDLLTRFPELQTLKGTLRMTAPSREMPFVDVMELKQRIDARRIQTSPSSKNVRSANAPGWYLFSGTAALGLALIVTAFFIGRRATVARSHGGASGEISTYVTHNGQRANITLTDGTTVALDVASRLDVPADYPTGNHALRLTGAALFTVVHHDGMPVTVTAGGTTARVLGTSFVVRHYATDSATTVAVRAGKVAVRTIALTTAQQAVVGSTGHVQVQPADSAQFSFATGVLTLDGMPLPQAIPELDRWYDADIRLGNARFAAQRMTGEYAVGSLVELADILALTFNARVVRDGRVLTLFPR